MDTPHHANHNKQPPPTTPTAARIMEESHTTAKDRCNKHGDASIKEACNAFADESKITQKDNDDDGAFSLCERAHKEKHHRFGFKINWMNMKDAESGDIVWSDAWEDGILDEEVQVHIPASILSLKAVSREINFSSTEEISDLRVSHRVVFDGRCIEEWNFDFGFCIPNSTNSWQQFILADGDRPMMTANVLSGNTVLESNFYDGVSPVFQCRVRIFYV